MTQRVHLLVGTKKGAFILDGDERRDRWTVRGPMCEGWPVGDVTWDPARGAVVAGGGSPWYGAAVWRSDDLGATWSHSSDGLTYGDDGPKLTTIWNVTAAHGRLFAGGDPAGLFRSDDGGLTWSHVAGLRDHPTTPEWQPGAGGLCLHTIVPHPTDPRRMWIGISAVGAFETTDDGATWELRNQGVRADFLPEKYPEFGQCVHKFVPAAGRPETFYQQNHCGMYRSDDGGRTWTELTDGLPSTFGFPAGAHPRDPDMAWLVPLNGAEEGRYAPGAALAVWRTRDGGATWDRHGEGLPQRDAYLAVLREAMAVDRLDPAGVYIGTSAGQLFASADEGVSWRPVAKHLPPITSVDVVVLD
jgi:photosystem II stability/assembly factor-like uncharacterized protein